VRYRLDALSGKRLLDRVEGTICLEYPPGRPRPYPALVRSLDPVAYWRFDDGDGAGGSVAADSSARGGHSGRYRNGVRLAARDLAGAGAGASAAVFDGLDDCIGDIPDRGFPAGDADRSFVAWVRCPPGGPANRHTSLFAYGRRSGTGHFGIGYTTASNPQADGVLFVSQWGDSVLTNPVGDGAWHFLAVTVRGARYRVYVDGQFVREKSMATRTVLTSKATIGLPSHLPGPGGGAWPFRGSLDEAALFARALTDQDIRNLYRAMTRPKAVAGPGGPGP
jgi:hypothetical protein